MFKKIILFLLVATTLFACKNQEKTTRRIRPLVNKRTGVLLKNVRENAADFDWLSLKVAAKFKILKKEDSFKMNVRMRKDSVIWISATYYAVEVARLYITPDSVKLMDRKNKQFFVGDFDYLNKKFGVELNFKSLQAILLGNLLGMSSDSIEIKSYTKKRLYHLNSYKRRKLRKAVKGKPNKIKDIAYSNSINPDNYRIVMSSIIDVFQNKSIFITYTEMQTLNGQLLPEKYVATIKEKEAVEVTFNYLKAQTGKKLKFSYKIPKKYTLIE